MREHIHIMLYRVYAVVVMAVILQFAATEASAQYYPERRMVRQGNELFSNRNYRSSLERYDSALAVDSMNYAALYNRANAYYQTMASGTADSTMSYEISNQHFERIANDELLSYEQRAEVLRNLGQSLFGQERYEAALNAFRQSLVLNPDDEETRYDYILTKRIVDQKRMTENQQQQNDQQNQDQQTQDQEQQNQDQQGGGEQEQDQEQNGGDDQQDNGEDGNDNGGSEDSQDSDQEDEGGNDEAEAEGEEDEESATPEPREITADQERMLDAIQAEEDRTQDRLREAQEGVVRPGHKNW